MPIETKQIQPANLIIAAFKWWEAKCPPDWTQIKHFKYPLINCLTDSEKALANEVIALFMQTDEGAEIIKEARGEA